MSSIFGRCNPGNKPVSEEDLTLMETTLSHWEPDGRGTWKNGVTGLGHLLLFNTPESFHEKQPLHDKETGLTITADARIDNRDDLFTLLGIDTPGEKMLPDGEIILRLYKKYGEDCPNYLVGDFAFAIWDERQHKLFCARDHMGIKPFFYYRDSSCFAFASAKKGLLCIPGINKAINKQYFYNQALGPRVQSPDTTFYEHIHRLSPAHSLTFYHALNELKLRRYWTLDPYSELKYTRREDYYEGLLHHFEEAVRCRLRSSFPIGAELSGGVDSSAITGAASFLLKNRGSNIITFSNVENENDKSKPENSGAMDRKGAEAVIRFNEIKDFVFLCKDIWEDTFEEIDFSLKVNDGLEMQSLMWELPIKKAAMQKEVRTLLSGFAGDQMVTYRGQFYFLDYLDKGKYFKYLSSKSERPFNRLKPFLPPAFEFGLHRIKNRLLLKKQELKLAAEFFNVPQSYRLKRGDVVWADENYRERYKSYRHYQKYRLLKPEPGLRMEAETRYGTYYKLEPRYPMADIRLTQYYLSLPNEIKYEGDSERYAFKKSIGRYLPKLVLERDGTEGSVAPFRSGKEALERRRFALLKMLDSFKKSSGFKDLILSQPFELKYMTPSFLELLRWCEKNFENF